jgi:MMPL family protein
VTRLGAVVFRRRRRVLAAGAVLFVVAAVLGAPVAGELEGAGLHDPDSESFRATEQIARATHRRVDFGLVAVGRPGGDVRSPGGLESTQPVLLFVIAFGLATDYGVFLLSRIKEARDAGLDDREAVAFGVERTGRIVTAAALLFCVAVGAFATSSIVFIKMVGLGTALAVAIDATIIRALLVPALMALLGKRNWWAPAPLRRLHARIGLSEAA